MSKLGRTPSQTVGPYFGMRLSGEGQNVVPADVPGERVRLEGVVLDGDRKPIEDALVELWQADTEGIYPHPRDPRASKKGGGFTGFARAASDFATGAYWFETVKPGRIPDAQAGLQAPHLSFIVQARGMLLPAFTRVYFADEAESNQHDLVLSCVPAARRPTLIATLVSNQPHKTYRFDLRFQGEDETVFFDF